MKLYQGLRRERVLASHQWDGKAFANPSGPWSMPFMDMLRILPDFLFGGAKRRPKHPLEMVRPHEAWLRPVDTGLRTTWLGHSTVLLEIDGYRILTDPVFGLRASPVSFAGPKRFHPMPAGLHELPPLDVVLLSHDHYDHLCAGTLSQLAHQPHLPIVTALGVGARLEKLGFPPERIFELDWDEAIDIKGLRFTATPSQHFSGRGLTDRNATLWASWVIQSEHHKVFFSGDTGYSEHFRETGAKYGPFDLVMLEIGAFQPGFEGIHLGPDNAFKVFEMLGGGTLLPIHWATFDLALHRWDAPAETLLELAKGSSHKLMTPSLGLVVEPSQLDGPNPWWRG